MKKPRQSGQHHGNLRESLVKNASRMVERGDTTFSLRELARRSGVTAAAVYHHFQSLEGVLDEVAANGFSQLDEAIDAAVVEGESPRQQFVQRIRAYLTFTTSHLAHYRIMFPANLGNDATHEHLRTVAESSFGRLLRSIQLMRPKDTYDRQFFLAFSAWSLCHGYVRLVAEGLMTDDMPFGPFQQLIPSIGELCADMVEKAAPAKKG
jgi:AcrR family transcriptional regulator